MEPTTAICFLLAAFASVSLLQLMRARHSDLTVKLQTYVKQQLEWAQKKAASLRMAKRAAAAKARQEAITAERLGLESGEKSQDENPEPKQPVVTEPAVDQLG